MPYPGQWRRLAHTPCECLTTASLVSFPQLTRAFSDVLRRRFQINTMSGMGYQYKSIFDAVRVIVGSEGVRGLYKGIAPNLLKVAPSMASSWLSFEFARDALVAMKPEPADDR